MQYPIWSCTNLLTLTTDILLLIRLLHSHKCSTSWHGYRNDYFPSYAHMYWRFGDAVSSLTIDILKLLVLTFAWIHILILDILVLMPSLSINLLSLILDLTSITLWIQHLLIMDIQMMYMQSDAASICARLDQYAHALMCFLVWNGIRGFFYFWFLKSVFVSV